jgi:hypothetical protein
MTPVTSELSTGNDFLWAGCLAPICLVNDVIKQDYLRVGRLTGDSLRGILSSYGIPNLGFSSCEFPAQSLPRAEGHISLDVKYPLLSKFNQNWNVSITFNEIAIISNFIEIRSVVFELLHEDGRPGGEKQTRHGETNR